MDVAGALEERIQNWPDIDEVSCSWCHDEGLVEVSAAPHPGAELTAMAPCPYCARGYRVEFGIGVRRNREGVVTDQWWANQNGGPWGKDGFWQGRLVEGVTKRARGAPLDEPPEWVQRWLRARKARDSRPFPEQAVALDEPPSAPFDDHSAWVQADEYTRGRVPTAVEALAIGKEMPE